LASKIKVDLHPIYNSSKAIDTALNDAFAEAERIKAASIEIIPGKGSGQLKKHVIRYLEQKEVKAKYHRIEKDSDNFGRLFVHFKWK
jgi:DNA-nicking Smr family endonuclease